MRVLSTNTSSFLAATRIIYIYEKYNILKIDLVYNLMTITGPLQIISKSSALYFSRKFE